MRRSLFLMALAGALGGLFIARAADSDLRASKSDVKKEIVAVIEAQLKAFRDGNANKAYTYSSRRLQAQRSLQGFIATVRTYYPEIWKNTGAEYGIARDDGQQAIVLVHVTSKEGAASYDYRLTKERAGWRISGVIPHEARPGERL